MSTEHDLIACAQKAFNETPLYKVLYQNEPKQLDEVPFISVSNYNRSWGLLDCITDREEMVSVIPSFHRNVRRFPFTVVEDEDEMVLRQERIKQALSETIDSPKEHLSFLIVTDENHGPFSGDMMGGVSWEGHQASIYYFNGNGDDLAQQSKAHNPDYLIISTPQLREHNFKTDIPCIWIKHLENDFSFSKTGCDWLYSDELNLIGWKKSTDSAWNTAHDQFYIETHPENQTTHLTTLQFSLYPFIRYSLGQILDITERGQN